MRILLILPLLAAAACSVDNDSNNDQVSVTYDQERIENAARTGARAAKDVGAAVGNVAVSTGRAIKNEVGDVDVDLDVRRRREEAAAANEAEPAR